MAHSVALTFPYGSSTTRQQASLQSTVQQLVRQKGNFRSVTEQGLLADIQEPAQEGEHGDDAIGSDVVVSETVQQTREKLFKSGHESIQWLEHAAQQMYALSDLLSLSQSGRSVAAQNQLTPELKQAVPPASMDSRVVEPKPTTRNMAKRLNDTSIITRTHAFSRSSERLAAASRHLDVEAQHQSKYWEQIAGLRGQGWPISRLPNNNRAIVVHFGSVESSAAYRSKGMAVLRQDNDGNLTFPTELELRRRKTVLVRVRRDGEVTGSYVCAKNLPTTSSRLEEDLLRAREALFQEELFTEASKEARLIANIGVKARSETIDFEVSLGCSISIAYAHHDANTVHQSRRDEDLARFVGTGLRLMLIAEHQHRHLLRSKHSPPPLSQHPRPSPEYAVLRPVVAQLRHHGALAPVLDMARTLAKSLQTAGFPTSVDQKLQQADTASPRLQVFRRIVVSEITINLPSTTSISISVETHLAAPRFGTQFTATPYESECGSSTPAPTSSAEEVIKHVECAMVSDVAHTILEKPLDGVRGMVGSQQPLWVIIPSAKVGRVRCGLSCDNGTIRMVLSKPDHADSLMVEWHNEQMSLVGSDKGLTDRTKSLGVIINLWLSSIS